MHRSKKLAQHLCVCTCLLFGACTASEEMPETMVKSAMDGLCEKFQQCTLESMELEAGSEDMPAAFMNMFIEQSKAQCAMLLKEENLDLEDERMVEKSIQCVNDMAASPCESLMLGKQPDSCSDLKNYQSQL